MTQIYYFPASSFPCVDVTDAFIIAHLLATCNPFAKTIQGGEYQVMKLLEPMGLC